MREKRQVGPHAAAHAWRVPVAQADVPETGLHFDLVADERVRAELAELAGLSSLPRLTATFDVKRHGRSGLHVVGRVSARVGQICGVTLETIENKIDEAIDLLFEPAAADRGGIAEPREVHVSLDDAAEPLIGGRVDLGALASEFFVLGIDPYPRKSGTVFKAPRRVHDQARPFEALAALKGKGREGENR
jgi:hypothetical protein